MAEHQLPKLNTGFRLPSPALLKTGRIGRVFVATVRILHSWRVASDCEHLYDAAGICEALAAHQRPNTVTLDAMPGWSSPTRWIAMPSALVATTFRERPLALRVPPRRWDYLAPHRGAVTGVLCGGYAVSCRSRSAIVSTVGWPAATSITRL